MTRTLIAAATAAAIAGPAAAQDWPTRPITIVVPFAAGGPVDVVARVVAPRMSELLGQPVIVDNIAGAGGMVGASRIAKADPDGYSILFGNQGTHTFSQILNKKPLYNAVTDFAAGGLAVSNTKLLVARKDLPANTLGEFIATAKAKHASMQYGSAGSGSATQIACVLLNAKIGIDVTHVPYRGTGPALQDLIAGRIDYVCDVTTTTAAQIRSGTVKAIAILSTRAPPSCPRCRPRSSRASPTSTPTAGTASSFPRTRRPPSSAASLRQ